jgi:hypothetical protein
MINFGGTVLLHGVGWMYEVRGWTDGSLDECVNPFGPHAELQKLWANRSITRSHWRAVKRMELILKSSCYSAIHSFQVTH